MESHHCEALGGKNLISSKNSMLQISATVLTNNPARTFARDTSDNFYSVMVLPNTSSESTVVHGRKGNRGSSIHANHTKIKRLT